jgi:hypothetical protein
VAEIRILSNGVTLVAERDPHSLSAAYGVFIRAGSCLEHPEQHGIPLRRGERTREPPEEVERLLVCLDDLGSPRLAGPR